MHNLKHFRMWCQKVIPLVYDDSLSYYEVLAKVRDKLNEAIDGVNQLSENDAKMEAEIKELQACCEEVENAIKGDLTEALIEVIREVIKMVFFGLTDAGYFVAYFPDGWDDITFNTTGWDYNLNDYEYGHLVLSY